MSKKSIKPLSLAVGTALVASLAATSNATAATDSNTNPFAMTELSSGYMQMIAYGDKKAEGEESHGDKYGKEGKCGEGKCGDKKEMKKNMEGKCGEKKSEKEGKCGEGKCGSKKE
jgi:uncharacterized low-complexity protein